MDSDLRICITAIRDVDQERGIASALFRLGWTVIYRATTSEGLVKAAQANPHALIIQSDDFRTIENEHEYDAVRVRGRSLPLEERAEVDPRSDSELDDLIRNRNSPDGISLREISALQKRVKVLASCGRSIGTTTLAISVAESLSLTGAKVLLVDGNIENPTLSSHFEIHGIREEVKSTRFGFSLFEVSNIEGLRNLAEVAITFDEIVIDFGEFKASGNWAHGKRAGDQLLSWLARSQSEFYLVTSAKSSTIKKMKQLLDTQPKLFLQHAHSALVVLKSAMTTKERRELISSFSIPVSIFSSDIRSVEKMESEHATLGISAPRSTLRSEISRYLS